MSGMDEAEQGVIAVVLLASYVVTPFMSLSVSTAVSVIVSVAHPFLVSCPGSLMHRRQGKLHSSQ